MFGLVMVECFFTQCGEDLADAGRAVRRDLFAHRQVEAHVQKRIRCAGLRMVFRRQCRRLMLEFRLVFRVRLDDRGNQMLQWLERLARAECVDNGKPLTLARAGAAVTVISPTVSGKLAGEIESGRIGWVKDSFREEQLGEAAVYIMGEGVNRA